MVVRSQQEAILLATPLGITLTSLQYTWTLLRLCCSQLCMGLASLTILSTVFSFESIVAVSSLTYVDATIRVVLQSGEEKKWERRKPFKVGFLEVTESDAPGTHYQRNAKKQDRPPFRPGLHMLSGF